MEKVNEIEPGAPVSGPGKVLQQARVDLQLTVEDVAAQLHLAPRQIVALENDDYISLPQATYVRGYLRSYASLVGLSPDAILQSHSRIVAGVGPRPVRLAPVDAEGRQGGDDHHVWWMTAGIGLVILALVYAWWQGSADNVSQSTTAMPSEQVAAPAEVGQNRTVLPQRAPLPPELRAQEAKRSPIAALPPPSAAPKPESATRPSAAESVNRVDPETRSGEEGVSAENPGAASDAPQPGAEAVNLPANVKLSRLALHVDVDSWAEVRDALDNRLLYRTVAAGQVVNLDGVPPFNVFLGNVDGVKVFVDGRAFDASRYKRGVTARFSVNASESGSR